MSELAQQISKDKKRKVSYNPHSSRQSAEGLQRQIIEGSWNYEGSRRGGWEILISLKRNRTYAGSYGRIKEENGGRGWSANERRFRVSFARLSIRTSWNRSRLRAVGLLLKAGLERPSGPRFVEELSSTSYCFHCSRGILENATTAWWYLGWRRRENTPRSFQRLNSFET